MSGYYESSDLIGTLIVFDLVLLTLLGVAVETLRIRLRAVPDTAALLAQQLASTTLELATLKTASARDTQRVADLEAKVEGIETALQDAKQRLQDARQRVPTTVYVLDQIIQPSHRPWLVAVRRGDPSQAPAGAPASDWSQGRRFLVFGDDAANARRRIAVRFPPAQGYRAADPQQIDLP
jgi:hypothetical protein